MSTASNLDINLIMVTTNLNCDIGCGFSIQVYACIDDSHPNRLATRPLSIHVLQVVGRLVTNSNTALITILLSS